MARAGTLTAARNWMGFGHRPTAPRTRGRSCGGGRRAVGRPRYEVAVAGCAVRTAPSDRDRGDQCRIPDNAVLTCPARRHDANNHSGRTAGWCAHISSRSDSAAGTLRRPTGPAQPGIGRRLGAVPPPPEAPTATAGDQPTATLPCDGGMTTAKSGQWLSLELKNFGASPCRS